MEKTATVRPVNKTRSRPKGKDQPKPKRDHDPAVIERLTVVKVVTLNKDGQQ